MKNKGGLFTGWRQVFNFTAAQNMKGTGFKASTIGIGILLFAIMIVVNCILADSQLDEQSKDPNQVIDIEETSIKNIYYIAEDDYSNQLLSTVVENIKAGLKNIQIKEATDEMLESKMSDEEGSMVMVAAFEDNVLKFYFNISRASKVEEDDVNEFAHQFVAVVDNMKYAMAGLSQIQIAMVGSSEMVYSDVVSVEEIDKELDMGLMIAEMVVPMVFTMVFYIMILTYCQSISKIVVAEKTSKLMETLLTSVKPYAVIAGKVLAMASIGIAQTLLWVLCGVAGFMAGDKIALKINPEYDNVISDIIGMMKTDSDIAFTATGIILAVICIVLGYLTYCTLAGLSGAVVGKIEDMAASQMIFMIPTIIGFMAAYILPVTSDSKALLTAIRMIPITSPFMVPAELIIGKITMWEGLLSIGILAVTCFTLVIVTGKIYKNKVFNR